MKTRKIVQRFVIGMCTCLWPAIVFSQDLHFSQYFNSPLLVNPANTGFSPDVDWRLGVNYRNQWASITTNPYKTMSAWGDAQLFNNRFPNGWVGIGGSVLKDAAGSGGLTSTKVYGSVAYHQMLGLNSLLSTGFSLGWVNQRVDFTKLTFDNQWNKNFFDVTIPSGEPFAYSSIGYLDLNVGVNYALFPSDNAYLNAGFSAQHLNRPKESFFSNTDIDARIPVRYTLFMNGSFKINDQWIVNPNTYISEMAKAYEVVLGLNAHYNLSGDGNTQLIAGLYYRYNDALIPMVGYQLNDYSITINYDVTTSALSTYNQARGAYELAIVKTGIFGGGFKAVKCPTVHF
ncbi:MAG TPA: PorP/SprF family type IX secretion system membrane protein [Chitinophagaceae bacterium]|nr:PorP/SprF family type IX secretion system membrane protein [Chitinophagaceae bacterium]